MSTPLHTFVRSALVAAVASVLSMASYAADTPAVIATPTLISIPTLSLVSSLAKLPSTTLIRPILIADLLEPEPTTPKEFAGASLLDKVGVYTTIPKAYQAVELDTNPILEGLSLLQQGKSLDMADHPIAKSVQLLKAANVAFNTDRIIQLNDKWFSFRSDEDPSANFEFDGKTGNLRFTAGLKDYAKEASTANLPKSTDEIIQIAASNLINLGLLPPLTEINLQKIEYGGVNMAIPDGKGGSQIFEKFKTIRAQRIIDGLEVEGDSRLLLQVGEQGSLVGLVSQWPKLREGEPLITTPVTLKSIGQPLTQTDLIPADSLREAAMANIQRVIAKAKTAELTEAKLVLYDDGNGVIEPAYHFVVNRIFDLSDGIRGSEDANTMIPYDFYLPVSNKSRAEFPDMEVVRTLPLGGKDETAINAGADDQ